MKRTAIKSSTASVLLATAAATMLAGCGVVPAHRTTAAEEPRMVAMPNTSAVMRPRLALVLSSGALRGFAHLGVIKVLNEAGIQPDLIVGTSAGALVGGLYASGLSNEQIVEASRKIDFDLMGGYLRTRFGGTNAPVFDFVSKHAQRGRIEDFPIRFAAVAADVQRGCLAAFNSGSAAQAIQASTALPGIFAAARVGENDYVDGGLVSPLPVRVARALGAERVIAVNVTFDPAESKLSGTIDHLFQTGLIMVRTLANQEGREADLLIEPQLPPEAQVTLENRAALVAAGERAARAALPRIRELVDRDPIRPVGTQVAMASGARWCQEPQRFQVAVR